MKRLILLLSETPRGAASLRLTSKGLICSGLLCLGLGGLETPAAFAVTGASPLRNLSAGTRLRAKTPIIIPANQSRELLSKSGQGSGQGSTRIRCELETVSPSPYTRVIPPGKELVIKGVFQGTLTSRRLSYAWTRLKLDSPSLRAVVCQSLVSGHKPDINEFTWAVRQSLAVVPNQDAMVIE